LFSRAVSPVEKFSSPRAWAFTLLGLNAYCTRTDNDENAERMRGLLADRLMTRFADAQNDNWRWFEDSLAYDNARLPQALIQTGIAMNRPHYIDVGIRSLRWLMTIQTTSYGHFRPIGSNGFGKLRQKPAAFDQQPVEAAATIAACIEAWRLDGGDEWTSGATLAFGWFLGENDLRSPLVDSETGRCWDGLHPDRPNENTGAESTLSYLLGLVDIWQHKREVAKARTQFIPDLVTTVPDRAIATRMLPGSHIVSTPIRKSAGPLPAPGPSQGRRQAVQAGDRTT